MKSFMSLFLHTLTLLVPFVTNNEGSLSPLERFRKLTRLGAGTSLIPDIVQDYLKPLLIELQSNNGEGQGVGLYDISPECDADFTRWAMDLSKPELWSLEMLDAWSKIPEGVFSGHFTTHGDFDECLRVRASSSEDGSSPGFKGKFCSTMFLTPEFCSLGNQNALRKMSQLQIHARSEDISTIMGYLMVTFGTCVPSSCSIDDIQNLMLAMLNDTMGLCVGVQHCQTDDRPLLRTNDIIMIVILSTIVGLCIVGTAMDVLFEWNTNKNESHQHSTGVQCLLAFSLYTNTRKWLNTNAGGSDNLGSIHGIRFFSTCWVVLGHTWGTMMPNVWNTVDLWSITEKKSWYLYVILNATISVDTFFTLSAILMAYNFLKTLEKTNGIINIPKLYLHRYLRLTPTYALMIGIMATLFEYLRPGPMTYQLSWVAESCRRNYWHNLLYINNLIEYDMEKPNEGACHGESWYLGNDMQFFLVSPFLLIALWKWKVIGLAVLSVFTVASVLVPFLITYHNKLDGTMYPMSPNFLDFMTKSYFKPWMRFGPYVVGLWGGYLIYKIRSSRTPIKIPALGVVIGWLTSTAVALAIIFGVMPHFDIAYDYDRLANTFYGGFHRFAWGAVVAWVVVACTMGYGGIINTFLSWKVFVPLGRLSFCVYLISYWLQNLMQLSMRQSVSYDLFYGINLFFSQMVMSLMLSFVASMTMESPFIALEKIAFGRGGTSKPVLQKPFDNINNSDKCMEDFSKNRKTVNPSPA